MIAGSRHEGRKKILTLGALYASIYLGQGFFYLSFVAILRGNDALLEQIGLIHLAGVFWVLKFLWAPLLDRYRLPFGNSKIAWIIVFQIAMAVSLIGICYCDIQKQFTSILLLFIIYSFFSATQEACVSSFVLTALSQAELGLGGGVQTAGGFWGTLIGGGGLLILYPYIGWQGAMLTMVALTLLPLVGMRSFSHPKTPVNYALRVNYKRFINFWTEQESFLWAILIASYAFALGMGYGVIIPALTDRGWSFSHIGLVVNILGALVGLSTSLSTGPFLRTINRQKALVLAAGVSLVAVCLFPCVSFAHNDLLIYISIFMFFLGGAFSQAVIVTVMMDKASPKSPATDFSLQFCIFSFIGVAAPYFGLTTAGKLGYQFVFYLMILFQATTLVITICYAKKYNNTQKIQ